MTRSNDEQRAQVEEQRRRLGVLQGIAGHAVAGLADGRLPWDTWLTHASRHGRYGFTNTLLIPAQRPSATDVRSYDAWQKQGRQVRRGETGIRIISTRGKPRTVFDIGQTDGQEIKRNECTPAEGLQRLFRLAADLDFYVDRGQGWTYLGRPGRRIPVPPELDETAAASLLAHQLAHALRPGGHIDTAGAYAASCRGVRRVMADSVAYLVLAELGLQVAHLSFPPPPRWAGTDVRTDSPAAIRAVGDQIVRTSTRIRRRLTEAAANSSHPASASPAFVREKPAHSQGDAPPARSAQQHPEASTADLRAALADAHHFFRRNLPGSWGAHYLIRRGFTATTQAQWEIGLAPRARQSLLRHLRQSGHHDQTLIECGLVKRRDNGELFDVFRDRVLFPLRDQDGEIVGFIGRRRDDASGPKYLNTAETTVYRKGEVLFGLHEARNQLAREARPMLVEGPLDAIAVNATLPETYAAVSPCGTAITASHIEAIAAHTDLAVSGLAIALDGDSAGRAGAIRAWRTLHSITAPLDVAVLPQGQDPAELLSTTRHPGVRESLLSVTPLADLLVDERIHKFGGALEFVESRLSAARAAAALIAELQPDQIGRQVNRVAARTGMDPAEITALVASAISPDLDSAASLSRPPARGPGPRSQSPRARTPSQRPNPHRRTV
ncbi:toprim domain-containing protein [Actinomadura madurae]|uniref:toprim domain-containing protein n=1 Tax=Actinomadura madurae TaxID=1993 RepID=UPI0020267681|nr:toprim domain-containing protein [Actinomadura madurae]URN07671.1 toprim domain-containing protein [Actinomadura madurae]